MDPPKILSCVVDIQGMRCQSCVKNIEKTIGAKTGILSIKVSLEQKEGCIEYDEVLVSSNQVAEFISDMGFHSTLKPSIDIQLNGKHFVVIIKFTTIQYFFLFYQVLQQVYLL